VSKPKILSWKGDGDNCLIYKGSTSTPHLYILAHITLLKPYALILHATPP
jgi:hypothetical protein